MEWELFAPPEPLILSLSPQLFDRAKFYPSSHPIGGEMTWATPPYLVHGVLKLVGAASGD